MLNVIILLFSFLFMIFIGVPLYVSMGMAGSLIILVFVGGMPINIIGQRIFYGVNSFTLLAIPFFIMAGDIMKRSGILDGLLKLADVLVGGIRGGLSHVNIVASMFFGGITGSAIADTSSIGSVLIPAMVKNGYSKSFSAAVTAASSVIGPIIPPSMFVIFYAYSWDVSIGALFLAGIIPGIMVGLSLLCVSYYISVKRNYPFRSYKITFKEKVFALKEAMLALIMPLIIVGGVFSGIATVTESAVLAVLYAIIIGFFVTRKLKIKDVLDVFLETAKTTALILILVASASIVSWILTRLQVGQMFVDYFLSFSESPIVFLLLVNLLFLIMGTFLNPSSSIIIMVPILAPLASKLGINPIHFGMVVITNLCIGVATPPVGMCLYVAAGIAKIPMEELLKEIWPFILIEIFVLLLITFIPQLTLIIPNFFYNY